MRVTPTSAQSGRKLRLDSLSFSTPVDYEIGMCGNCSVSARNLCGDLTFDGRVARKMQRAPWAQDAGGVSGSGSRWKSGHKSGAGRAGTGGFQANDPAPNSLAQVDPQSLLPESPTASAGKSSATSANRVLSGEELSNPTMCWWRLEPALN
jgi:hypothetical protein